MPLTRPSPSHRIDRTAIHYTSITPSANLTMTAKKASGGVLGGAVGLADFGADVCCVDAVSPPQMAV